MHRFSFAANRIRFDSFTDRLDVFANARNIMPVSQRNLSLRVRQHPRWLLVPLGSRHRYCRTR